MRKPLSHRTKQAILAGVLAVFVIIAALLLHHPSPLPADIRAQLAFSPFVVTDPRGNNVTVSGYKYDKSKALLSYEIELADSHSFIISEQAAPPSFDEIPDSYSKFLSDLNQFDTIETSNGPLSLTQPQKNFTAGVLHDRGVLLFIRANDQGVSNTEWKQVAEMLNITKISH